MQGLVVKNTGSQYFVHTDDGRTVACAIRGAFRLKDIKSTNPVVIGDRVTIDESGEGTAFIAEISDRRNYMIRRATNLSKQSHIIAANIDLAALVVTVNYPETTTVFIDRFLATAEAYRIPVHFIFNKTDRYDADEMAYSDALMQLYGSIGYRSTKACAISGGGIDELKNLFAGKITLLSGHSGVGKSTIINRLIPELKLKTNSISEYHRKGMHTTTFSEMIPLGGGGYIIDTPGIKGFGMLDMTGAEVSHYFPEIFRFASACRFSNCTHRNEPDCAVRKAVDNQYVSESRYRSYLNILEDGDDNKYREAYH